MTDLPDLYHFSDEPLTAVRSLPQNCAPEMKPMGLWLSAETGDPDDISWNAWCELEGFNLDRLACCTPVRIAPDARVLHLRTEEEVRSFDAEYASSIIEGSDELLGAKLSSRWVHWARVADKYQGIVIAPYQHRLRMELGFLWYYGWDCASGCVWDADAIESVGPPVENKGRRERKEERMGSAPPPKEPEPVGPQDKPLELGEIARTILSDARLRHRYLLFAAGWKPDGSGVNSVSEGSPEYRAQQRRLWRAAEGR